jgi:hypothetical protein
MLFSYQVVFEIVILSLVCEFGAQTNEISACFTSYNGTTPLLEYIFKGRCSYFINILHQDDCDIQSKNYDCDLIWKEFSNSILNKNPCDVTTSSYARFFQLTDNPIKPNTSMFWSGVLDAARTCKIAFFYLFTSSPFFFKCLL